MSIEFEEFQKIDLRVAKIITAQAVEGSDKLIKIQATLGDQERQIVAGLRPHYQPEDLIGRQIVIVANLSPRQLMGETSQGMLLAADNAGVPVLIEPSDSVNPGSKIN